jgi:argininosuccinate synthase
VPRTIFAFNGDLESRLALHWLAHELGHEVVALSVNLGQEIYLEPLAEQALELGAVSARVVDSREVFLRDFAFPALQAGAVYQTGCYLGSALGRCLIAQEMVLAAREEGCTTVAHGSASKGNDQIRLETAIAALAPNLAVLAPVRHWTLRSHQEKVNYARRRGLTAETAAPQSVVIDRNLWGASIYLDNLGDPWEDPPAEAFTLTRPSQDAPDQPAVPVVEFEQGVPVGLDGKRMKPVPLVRELHRLGGLHAVGRSDVIEDRLFGIKTREFYETPAPTILMTAHRDLENLVQSRELINLKEILRRKYAELVYTGLWFHDLREALQGFFQQTQRFVTGEVRLKLFKGQCRVQGRRSPHSLYSGQLACQSNQEWFDNRWAEGFSSLWTLPTRLAARRRLGETPEGPNPSLQDSPSPPR